MLRQHLVDEMRSVVITSATLRVDGEFDHFLQRSGLDTPDLRLRLCTEALASPFDYPNQVFLALPTDLPAPDRGSYVGDVADAIVQAVRISQGRAFVLLTSYRSLHQIADAVSRQLSAEFALLRQGDLPRTQLLERFVAARKGVLFGTDSFWEGVDVRGDALSLVVLPRLPFRVPTEPIQQARCERIVARGGDAFADLSLPQAVLRFRQGFGRLIRHRDDRGTVLVLDTRLHSRSYGPRFLQSLPDGLKGMKTPAEPIYEEMERFFRSR